MFKIDIIFLPDLKICFQPNQSQDDLPQYGFKGSDSAGEKILIPKWGRHSLYDAMIPPDPPKKTLL